MSETRSVETTAQDIETAIEIGLERLGVARESVIVEILEEPSRGLLGLGARQARIRLTTAAPPRQEAPAPAPEAAPVEAELLPDEEEEAVAEWDDEAEEEEPALDHERAERHRSEKSARRRSSADTGELSPASEDDLDEDAIIGRATLQELLEKMDVSADVIVYRAKAETGEVAPWILQIQGDDLGTLIGRRGETLAALQYITRLIVSRELQRRANLVLDVEGYKSRREKMLRRLADRMAKQAVETKRTVSLEPMSPYERRIVHLQLRDHDDVTTQSVGEGDSRKVTIIPNDRR